MVNVARTLRSLGEQPGYTAMRGLARFPALRAVISAAHGAFNYRGYSGLLAECENRLTQSAFHSVDRARFLRDLSVDGVAFGLTLPACIVNDIREYSDEAVTYADRNPRLGFRHFARDEADTKVGKPILVAQYFNTTRDCPVIGHLSKDSFLLWVAASYLGSIPTFVGANLWWTFPVMAREEDRSKHAHRYHRDVDDFRFIKFFFYLTDVQEGEGAHVCVAASHANPPVLKRGDRWNIRRYSDKEIEGYYPVSQIKEICGEAGTGFAEDTLCIHKGSTPKSKPRLLLQLQYGLFNYGVMSDERDQSLLKRL